MSKIVKNNGKRESGVTLSGLRTFVAVAESGSFSKAASGFGVSQPTVSIQLNNLELAYGTPLLHRRPKIALTEAGRELFVRARQIVSRLDEFDAVIDELSSLKRGRLSLGLSTPAYAMPILAAFLADQPAVHVVTMIGNTTTLLEEIAQCKIDVGVMTLDKPVRGLHCVLVAPQRLTVCVARGDSWAGLPSVRIQELPSRNLVMREQGSMTRQLAEEAFSRAGIQPTSQVVVGSRETVKEAVAAGVGVGVLLEGELGSDTRLMELALCESDIVGGVYAVTLKETVDIPAVGAFLAYASSVRLPAPVPTLRPSA